MEKIEDSVVPALSPPLRMALAHAARRTRTPFAALFALDARLGAIVGGAREPMLAQLRLAWWRDRLAAPTAQWPAGEPVLAALRSWDGAHGQLAALVDGWEALTGEAPLPDERLMQFATGRAAAFAALAGVAGAGGHAAEALRCAREWALADLSGKLSDSRERGAVFRLGERESWHRARLPRTLRPLAILHALALRERAGRTGGAGAFATALRVGLIGL